MELVYIIGVNEEGYPYADDTVYEEFRDFDKMLVFMQYLKDHQITPEQYQRDHTKYRRLAMDDGIT